MDNLRLSLNMDAIKEKDFRVAFDMIAKGRDIIDVDDINAMMKEIGLTVTVEEVGEMLKTVDEDKNNTIELDEFIKLMDSKMKEEDTEKLLLETFNIFDSDNTGYISYSELKNIFESLNCLSTSEITAMLDKCEKDHTGQQVKYEQLVKNLYY